MLPKLLEEEYILMRGKIKKIFNKLKCHKTKPGS
jgi:hypothetical protein